MGNDIVTEAQKFAEELFKKLEINAKPTVEKEEEVIKIIVETEDSGILIGYHGETLLALQLILSLMLYKKLGTWTTISLHIGDYKERREESLKIMAQRAVEKALATQSLVVLPYLRADERRVIHLYLKDHPDVTSTSEGEGPNRRLVISPKTK